MSKDSSERPADPALQVNWNPWLGVLYAFAVFYVAQVLAGLIVAIYPALHHWSGKQSADWLNNSVIAQFIFVLLAETLTVWAVYIFLKRRRAPLSGIALKKPRLADPIYGLAGLPLYLILYVLTVGVV